MTYFIRNGINYNISPEGAIDIHNTLPAGNYIIKEDAFENLFLQKVENFVPVKKIYGNIDRYAKRIIDTYKGRDVSTGVLLTGEKGSGKTMLAKKLSIDLGEQGVPTIIINSPWTGDKFNKFLQDINQPCVVLFDEFEKVYDEDNQEFILTLLDGVFPSSKLFLLTCNDKWRIDSHMRNRPGRIYYMIDFTGLDVDFIREYCIDNLNNTKHIDSICTISAMFSEFNFDMLKALVEEMNRYDETPQDAMLMLNAKPEFSNDSEFNVEIKVNGIKVHKVNSNSTWEGNPMSSSELYFRYCINKDDDDWETIQMTQENITKILPQEGKYFFEKEHVSVTLTRKVNFKYDWRAI